MKILIAINLVQRALAATGIAKSQRNQAQNYNFRGIDDFLSTLAPLLAEHLIAIFPVASEYSVVETESKSGGVLFKTTVEVTYELVHAEDGSSRKTTVYGEAMDSGDKGMNKAFSAAYKLMAWQTFCIPVGGAMDTENESHETHGSRKQPQQQRPAPRPPAAARRSAPSCPSCGNVESTHASTRGTGFYCNPKSQGCGRSFQASDVGSAPPSPEQNADMDAEVEAMFNR